MILTYSGELFYKDGQPFWKLADEVKDFHKSILLLKNGDVAYMKLNGEDKPAKIKKLGENFSEIEITPLGEVGIRKTDGSLYINSYEDIYYTLDENNQESKYYVDEQGYFYGKSRYGYYKHENIGPIQKHEGTHPHLILNLAGDLWYSNDGSNFIKSLLSSKSLELKINNEKKVLQTSIQFVDDRTMYPFRECLELMGASVFWDDIQQVAVGEMPGVRVEFPINEKVYYVNGEKFEMDVATYVDETIGRTYIPIRYAAESFGYIVDWQEGEVENSIHIYLK